LRQLPTSWYRLRRIGFAHNALGIPPHHPHLATTRDLDIMQFDITSAYLHDALKEEVYMEQPKSYVAPGRMLGYGTLRRAITGEYKLAERGTRS